MRRSSKQAQIEELVSKLSRKEEECIQLQYQLNTMRNTRGDPLMEQRIKLASTVGQLMQTTSEVVKFIIGKEVA